MRTYNPVSDAVAAALHAEIEARAERVLQAKLGDVDAEIERRANVRAAHLYEARSFRLVAAQDGAQAAASGPDAPATPDGQPPPGLSWDDPSLAHYRPQPRTGRRLRRPRAYWTGSAKWLRRVPHELAWDRSDRMKGKREGVYWPPLILAAVGTGTVAALDEWFGRSWDRWIYYSLSVGAISVGFGIGWFWWWWRHRTWPPNPDEKPVSRD